MKKTIFFITITSFLLLGFSFVLAAAGEKTTATENNPTQLSLEDKLNQSQTTNKTKESGFWKKWEIPDWVKRTNFAIEAGTDRKPKYFLESIQPLFSTQQDDLVFFNQLRVSHQSSKPTYNYGLGARKILNDKYLLGLNMFYDYQALHRHSRGGVGLEAMSDIGLEARVNGYLKISNQRLVKDDGINEYYEKVANGFDWELGMPLPYIPSVKVYGGGNWYDFGNFKNKYGWQFRAEFTPMKYSRIDFIVSDDNKSNKVAYGFEGALTFGFTSFALQDIIKDLTSAKSAYPKIDLHDKTLDRVVRDFDITVIKSTKSKSTGLTVEGGLL